MNFKSDNQRKACFANMSRFSRSSSGTSDRHYLQEFVTDLSSYDDFDDEILLKAKLPDKPRTDEEIATLKAKISQVEHGGSGKKKFYHGSAGFGGRIIRVDGLKPASQQERVNRGYGQKSDPDYVYMTSDKDLAKIYAERNAHALDDDKFGPVVYEVEMEEGDLEPDIEFPSSFKYKGKISKEHIKEVKFSDKKSCLKCSKCGNQLDLVDVFPGNRCMQCYEKDFDNNKSEDNKIQDFKSSWGGGVIR